jgi:hypothetical protein
LGRLSKSPQKSSSHSFRINETRFDGHFVDRMSTGFNHYARRFQAQILDGFGRGLSRLCAKRAAELTRAQMRSFSQFFNTHQRS